MVFAPMQVCVFLHSRSNTPKSMPAANVCIQSKLVSWRQGGRRICPSFTSGKGIAIVLWLVLREWLTETIVSVVFISHWQRVPLCSVYIILVC